MDLELSPDMQERSNNDGSYYSFLGFDLKNSPEAVGPSCGQLTALQKHIEAYANSAFGRDIGVTYFARALWRRGDMKASESRLYDSRNLSDSEFEYNISIPKFAIESSYSTIECSPESFMRTTRARGKPLELPNVQEGTLEYNLKKKMKSTNE